MRIKVLCGMLFVLWSSLSWGQAAGVGLSSCGEFLDQTYGSNADDAMKLAYVSWAYGYMTGQGSANSNTAIPMSLVPDPRSLLLYLQKFCRAEPLQVVVVGVSSLQLELRRNARLVSPVK